MTVQQSVYCVQIDQPGSAIDAYIGGLRDVLERKASNIAQLQGRLESFQVIPMTTIYIRFLRNQSSCHFGQHTHCFKEGITSATDVIRSPIRLNLLQPHQVYQMFVSQEDVPNEECTLSRYSSTNFGNTISSPCYMRAREGVSRRWCAAMGNILQTGDCCQNVIRCKRRLYIQPPAAF